ncbi:MAG: hypothetical protein M1812_001571 [Candelaria pacifica]|nr:MAG: hypothetical protein M1812_001571 [Candelaria pacifica]
MICARKWFKGPKVNVEHQRLGRNENDEDEDEDVVEGLRVGEGDSGSSSLEGKDKVVKGM